MLVGHYRIVCVEMGIVVGGVRDMELDRLVKCWRGLGGVKGLGMKHLRSL